MQTTACTFKAGVAPRATTRAVRRAPVTCVALSIKECAKGAAVAAASLALVLGTGAPVEAAQRGPTAYERNSSYEQELLEGLKARGAKQLELTSSPEGNVVEKVNVPALKLSGFEKTALETPEAVPAPAPAAPATVAPPKAFNPADVPKAAPVAEPEEVVVKAAPAPAAPAPTAPTVGAGSAAPTQFGTASSASTGGDNKTVLIGGGVAAVAIAAVVASGAKGDEGEAATDSTPAAAAPPAAATSSDVPPNVAEARAWIAAWRARTQK